MNAKLIATVLAYCTLTSVCITNPETTEKSNVVGDVELREAVKLAVADVKAHLVKAKRTGPNEYRLVAAQNLLPKGLNVWLVTFKPAKLIPADPTKEIIGAGGEIFVTVDLKTRECILRYGE